MTLIRPATALFLSLASAGAAAPDALTLSEARHLLSRTGFGAAPHEIEAFAGLSAEEAVARLLDGVREAPSVPMPAWTEDWLYPYEEIWTLGQTAEELFAANREIEMGSLQQWWLAEMIATPSPLTERLTLFWHDHFATSFAGVEVGHWMAAQNALLRRHAAGSFADLATEILEDPALLVWLTNTDNAADAPNENLGREYLELFTLGEGRGYTEADVVEAARALTGQGIAELSGQGFAFHAELHDHGRKIILGQSGRHGPDDLARIVLSHPAFGPYVVEKLWREFVSDSPDPQEIARLTALWHAADLELSPLLEALFLSEAFWDPTNRGRLIKDPVELFVGTVRTLGIRVPDLGDAVWILGELGQELFFPPNVGGWPEGTAWITDATVAARATLLTHLLEWEMEADRLARGMMASDVTDAAPARTIGAKDLRVGQVFLREAEVWEEGAGALLTLFDVGFGGRNVRSITLWLEGEEERPPALSIFLGDCACLASWPWAEGGWAHIEADQELGDAVSETDGGDAALIRLLVTHLPALIETTVDQPMWDRRRREDEGLDPIAPAEFLSLARSLETGVADAIGAAPGALHLALSAPNRLGLGGSLTAGPLSEDEYDALFEEREAALSYAGVPAVVYGSAAEWLAAVPGFLASDRATTALLALPPEAEGRRISMVEDDPAALLRALVLHPHYQVN
ncbi:MAG: DUF1800 domain-containing protein [Pseudomonadota bacterium]